MLPEVLAGRLFQSQKAMHHLELAGPPSHRVMHRKGKSRGVWEGWAPVEQRAEVSLFYVRLFYLCDGNRTRPQRDTKRKHYETQ